MGGEGCRSQLRQRVLVVHAWSSRADIVGILHEHSSRRWSNSMGKRMIMLAEALVIDARLVCNSQTSRLQMMINCHAVCSASTQPTRGVRIMLSEEHTLRMSLEQSMRKRRMPTHTLPAKTNRRGLVG